MNFDRVAVAVIEERLQLRLGLVAAQREGPGSECFADFGALGPASDKFTDLGAEGLGVFLRRQQRDGLGITSSRRPFTQ